MQTLFSHDFFIHGGAVVQFEYKILTLATNAKSARFLDSEGVLWSFQRVKEEIRVVRKVNIY
jgi:hypothetical protein